MPTINWRRVLDEHSVEYVERGPNVKRGELNIQCPFCGTSDPSHHLGLNLQSGWWACWRNDQHRGKSPVRLLVKLLRVSYAKALELAGLDDSYVDPDGFDGILDRLSGKESPREEEQKELKLPGEFYPVGSGSVRTRMAEKYLVEVRGFLHQDVPRLNEWYGICTAVAGEQAGRIIFPYFEDGRLVTWTGRAIGDSVIRYKDLPPNKSLVPGKKTLYNFDCLQKGGEVLVICEGPFDALKLDLYGRDWGLRAVALSTNSIQEEQLYILDEYSGNFAASIVMLDSADSLGVVDSMRMGGKLGQIRNIEFRKVPFARKDGAEMLPNEIISYARSITNEIGNRRVQPNPEKSFQREYASRGNARRRQE